MTTGHEEEQSLNLPLGGLHLHFRLAAQLGTLLQGCMLPPHGRPLPFKFETVRVNFPLTRACVTSEYADFEPVEEALCSKWKKMHCFSCSQTITSLMNYQEPNRFGLIL